MSSNCPKTTFLKKKITQLVLLKISQGPVNIGGVPFFVLCILD